MKEIRARIYYLFLSKPIKDSPEVLYGVDIYTKDVTLLESFIQKYKKEMPNAVITSETVEKDKQTYGSLFTRTELEHIMTLKEGAKVVKIITREYKTVYTAFYNSKSPKDREYHLVRYYNECNNTKCSDVSREMTSWYNSPRVSINITIYDEAQLKAYNKLYMNHLKTKNLEKEQNRQKQLNF
jgi:hypothetical protein